MSVTKFRAWDTENKKMINPGWWGVQSSTGRLFDNEANYTPYSGTEIVMRFIGIYDNKGNEIYEGDILDISSSYYKGKYFAVVQIPSLIEGVQLNLFTRNCSLGILGRQWWADKKHQDQYVVVGNIYENPELIK